MNNIYYVSCLSNVGYLLPKTSGINKSIRYPAQSMLVTCNQKYRESKHQLGILFRRCWLLAPKDIKNHHIYQVSCLGNVGYLLLKTLGINTSIWYYVQAMLVTCCQRHRESTHLLGIMLRQCWLLAAKDIRNLHIYQESYLGDVGYLLPKTINTSIWYHVYTMLATCCQRHKESTH